MNDVAASLLTLCVIAVLGLSLGQVKVRGVGLGLGGVLFGGIAVGRYVQRVDLEPDLHVLQFMQEFGLILFVYTIGIQVGPGFFAAMRTSGLRLNVLSASVVLLGVVMAVAVGGLAHLPIPVMLGILSGAVTNTPSLAATQQVLGKLGFSNHALAMPALGYAVAYPFGILGLLLAMWLLRVLLKLRVDSEAAQFERDRERISPKLQSSNVRVTNTNFDGLSLRTVPGMDKDEAAVVCSRLKRDGALSIPKPDTQLRVGDLLHLVGPAEALRDIQLILGELCAETLTTKDTLLRVERVVVTRASVLGKTLAELEIGHREQGIVSRLNRAGVELLPRDDLTLQFGDILNVVGSPQDIAAIAEVVGNSTRMLGQVQMIPVFIGIGIGVLLGMVPLPVPGLPTPVRLGMAGGPLVAAITLSRVGNVGPLYWFMPPSAALALRELGIVLFLSVVGLKAGSHVGEVLNREGLLWLGCGAAITLVPLLLVGLAARHLFKLNYLTICGMLAGSCTDPPALAFASSLSDSEAPALAYASVYPVVMALRILSPQVIAILLGTMN
jgi:putative transport protein